MRFLKRRYKSLILILITSFIVGYFPTLGVGMAVGIALANLEAIDDKMERADEFFRTFDKFLKDCDKTKD